MNTSLLEINHSGELHVQGLKKAQHILIKNIKEGTKTCIEQVSKLLKGEEVTKLQNEISEQIGGIRQALNELKDKRDRFESMDIVEKLYKPSIQITENDMKLPSLDAAKELASKLKVAVNYEEAIKKSYFPIG